jgi:hypothetical protein
MQKKIVSYFLVILFPVLFLTACKEAGVADLKIKQIDSTQLSRLAAFY